MTTLSVVAPIYNEGSLVSEFVKQVVENISKITSDYEVILVDDGSVDDSWSYMESEASKNTKVKAYRLSNISWVYVNQCSPANNYVIL